MFISKNKSLSKLLDSDIHLNHDFVVTNESGLGKTNFVVWRCGELGYKPIGKLYTLNDAINFCTSKESPNLIKDSYQVLPTDGNGHALIVYSNAIKNQIDSILENQYILNEFAYEIGNTGYTLATCDRDNREESDHEATFISYITNPEMLRDIHYMSSIRMEKLQEDLEDLEGDAKESVSREINRLVSLISLIEERGIQLDY